MKESRLPEKEYSRDRLIGLRQELAVFNTMPCRMIHEKAVGVIEDPFSGDPDYEGLTILRRGLCPKELRRTTLGCAHTPANEAFGKLLDELSKVTGISKEASPWSELTNVIVAIYKLEHEKGNLEKRLAVLARSEEQDQEQKVIVDRLGEVTTTHVHAVAALEKIRLETLQTIDKLLMDNV